MPLRRILLIANPAARGFSNAGHREVLDCLNAGTPTESRLSRSPEETCRWAAEEGRDPDTLIAISGGDGTLFQAINGLPPQGTIGLIPTGTANVIAKDLGIPLSPREAAKTLLCGACRTLDTGRVHPKHSPGGSPGRRFLMSAGFGFDAHVAGSVPRFTKRLLGQFAYHLETVWRYACYQPPAIEVSVDGGSSLPGRFALVANLRRYGGNLFFAPEARIDDGLLDLVLFRELTPRFLLRGLWEAISRRGVSEEVAWRRRGRQFHLRSDRPIPYQLDGEVLPDLEECDIVAEPSSLRMILP